MSAAAAQLAAAIAQGEQRVPAAAADLARPVTPSGQIPPDLVAAYREAEEEGGKASLTGLVPALRPMLTPYVGLS